MLNSRTSIRRGWTHFTCFAFEPNGNCFDSSYISAAASMSPVQNDTIYKTPGLGERSNDIHIAQGCNRQVLPFSSEQCNGKSYFDCSGKQFQSMIAHWWYQQNKGSMHSALYPWTQMPTGVQSWVTSQQHSADTEKHALCKHEYSSPSPMKILEKDDQINRRSKNAKK